MRIPIALLTACVVFLLASPAMAILVDIEFDDGRQDTLKVPNRMHELGNQPAFPDNEWIDSDKASTEYIPCPQNYDPAGPANVLVKITNRTNTFWRDLHYVADVESTTLTNDDGWINGGLAFRIDNLGVNTPLLSESLNANLIFEPGETWEFVVQNYAGPAAPSVFDSPGMVGNASMGFPPSTASIVAVPEPGTLALLAISGLLLIPLWQWRRR